MGKDYKFDFERLEVYQKTLELIRKIFQLMRVLPREYQYSLADQLRRAGLSILNNLAEGSGQLSKKEKGRYYRISLNSSRECIPMLTLLWQEHQISPSTHQELREEIVHIANMLGKLIGSLNI
ncbi:MAG: four helix bundle protein [Chlamydiae bacterium]|nr:four helix bundle protein [Chlamydiota bacterium]MBI3276707.1 four helix bundle protein [Chlamydiota bacterium]